MTAALEARGLTKEFRGFVAVNDVNLSVETGSIHALIGPNGAGKTTCFNLLTKFLKPTAGKIIYKGQDITALSPTQIARLGIVRSFQISAIFPDLTVLQNVRIALQRRRGESFDFWRSEKTLSRYDDKARDYLEEVGLTEFERHRAAELPYGRKRALEIATTLALDPEMLLLDEPMAGLDATAQHQFLDIIDRLREGGATVVLSTHDLSCVSQRCDKAACLNRRLVAYGTPEEVLNEDVLGETFGTHLLLVHVDGQAYAYQHHSHAPPSDIGDSGGK
ncbi:ABC transporter ATP-binding protein [Paracoccus sp. UBA889]|uniref:ABC transporter ATP-binding protein n=1 Tax=Paracoccus sp. UBA889 TaxID=1947056 RepID=UPI0025E6DF5E|nr:ABC transporter ATP-binding protein [Paracoccus sp. UBA889]